VLNTEFKRAVVPIVGDRHCVVLDNVLTAPELLVALSSHHLEAFLPVRHNGYPGVELPLPDAALTPFIDLFVKEAGAALGVSSVIAAAGRLSMVTRGADELTPLQRVCHRDRLGAGTGQVAAAGVLYLFEDPALGGTAFFRPRLGEERANQLIEKLSSATEEEADELLGSHRCYLASSNAHFEHLVTVAPGFNRLIFYDGSVFHSSAISAPEKLSADPRRGRLTLNLFFLGQQTKAPGPYSNG